MLVKLITVAAFVVVATGAHAATMLPRAYAGGYIEYWFQSIRLIEGSNPTGNFRGEFKIKEIGDAFGNVGEVGNVASKSLDVVATDGEVVNDFSSGAIFISNETNYDYQYEFVIQGHAFAKAHRPILYDLRPMGASAFTTIEKNGVIEGIARAEAFIPSGRCDPAVSWCEGSDDENPFVWLDEQTDFVSVPVEEVLKPGQTALYEWRMQLGAEAAPIPLPASAWLLASAVGAVVAWGKRPRTGF